MNKLTTKELKKQMAILKDLEGLSVNSISIEEVSVPINTPFGEVVGNYVEGEHFENDKDWERWANDITLKVNFILEKLEEYDNR